MSKQGGSPNYEYGGSCGGAKGAQQLTFMYSSAAIRRHVSFGRKGFRAEKFCAGPLLVDEMHFLLFRLIS